MDPDRDDDQQPDEEQKVFPLFRSSKMEERVKQMKERGELLAHHLPKWAKQLLVILTIGMVLIMVTSEAKLSKMVDQANSIEYVKKLKEAQRFIISGWSDTGPEEPQPGDLVIPPRDQWEK